MRNILIFLTVGLSALFAQQDSLIQEAINRIEEGNGEAAYELFSRCIEQNDTLAEAWFGRAQAGMMVHIPDDLMASKAAYRNPVTMIQSRMDSVDTDGLSRIIADIGRGMELAPQATDNLWGLPFVYILLDSLEKTDEVLGEIVASSQELRGKLMALSTRFYVQLEIVNRRGVFGKETDETQALAGTAAELGSSTGASGTYYDAVADMALGHKESALSKLRDSFGAATMSVEYVKADPAWDSVRDSETYLQIIEDAERGFEDMRGKSLGE